MSEDVASGEQERQMRAMANRHKLEAARIQAELDGLGLEFAEDGIVKTILRRRIATELHEADLYSVYPRIAESAG